MSSSAAKTGMIVGLSVSGLIVLIVVGLILYFALGGKSIGAPTKDTTAPGVLEKMQLSLDVSGFVKMPAEGGGGAEKLYEEAFKLAWTVGDTHFVAIVKESREPENDPKIKPVIDKILQAADAGMGSDVVLNFDSAEVSIGPKTSWPIRDVLAAAARATCKAGMSARADGKREEAEKHFRAAFVMGKRLWDHGAFVAYKSAGLAAMSESLANYQSSFSKNWYKEPAKEEMAKQAYAAYLDVSKSFADKERITHTVKPIPGDLHNLAQKDKDLAWRLEGIMFLGMAKWTSAGKGEREAIETYLRSKAGGDGLIARKAKEATEFSRADVGLIPAQ